jgi:hypothetical protein
MPQGWITHRFPGAAKRHPGSRAKGSKQRPSCLWVPDRAARVRECGYLIASGLIGEPVPPVMTSGGPQNRNS